MIVPSLPFLLFAAVAAAAFNVSGAVAWRQGVLLVANLAFLASFSHDPLALLPLAGFLALGYGAQRTVRRGGHPRLFVGLLLLILLSFFWLKRYAFIPGAALLPFPYVLVGLSYLFFRVLHLVIDSHEGAVEEPPGIVGYLNYTLNFTSLTSGPIQRYQDYRQTQAEPPPLDIVAAGRAVERIVIGYAKVALVSPALSLWQHHAIDALSPGQPLADRIWSGALVAAIYPVYLYFNFSGYVDVVIGVARFLRIVLPENFDRPFSSLNFIDFWNRWHITLSQWLRSYVFTPLLMTWMRRDKAARKKQYPGIVALFVTFFLVGAWHGQTSEFLFFGLLQGGGVAANRLYQVAAARRLTPGGYQRLSAHRLYQAAARGLTFTWFTFTLLWFWASWPQIGGFAQALGGTAALAAWLVIFAAATVLLAAKEFTRAVASKQSWTVDRGVREPVVRSRYVRVAWDTALFVVTTAIIVLLDSPAPEIVYKSF